MSEATLIVRHARAARMTGEQQKPGDAPLDLLEDAALVAAGPHLIWIGADAELPASPRAPGCVELDAQGSLVTPGLVDPHTHLLFAGDRGHEHAQRLAGRSYLEIAQAGGGIRATVRATRAASDEQLLAAARARLRRLVEGGVTTAEVKSGYGLSVEQELRLLQLVQQAAEGAGCDVEATLLGLHAVPEGKDQADWVHEVVTELTPAAARAGLARHCDAFLEKGAFTARECRFALEAGVRVGLRPHLHADQLSDGGGAALAAELGCASADHLERTSRAGAEAMARAGTVATLLPLAAWFLRDPKPAQAKLFLDAGCTVALGGNVNPGSQRIESVSMLLAAGCLISGLTPAQALFAMTAGAAQALQRRDRGKLRPGARADLVIWAARDADHLAYHAGVDHARAVIRRGELVVDRRAAAPLLCD
jgi:imidazolonepropionase